MKSKTLEAFINREFTVELTYDVAKVIEDNTNLTWIYGSQKPSKWLKANWVSVYGYGKLCTDQEHIKLSAKDFIRKVKEEMNNFDKDDLVKGKYVVKFKNGEYRLFLFDGFINENGEDSIHINNCYFDSKEGGDWNTAIEVFTINSCSSHSLDLINVLNDNEDYLTSVWKREEKSQARVEYEKLQEQIKQLQEQANKLEPEIQ